MVHVASHGESRLMSRPPRDSGTAGTAMSQPRYKQTELRFHFHACEWPALSSSDSPRGRLRGRPRPLFTGGSPSAFPLCCDSSTAVGSHSPSASLSLSSYPRASSRALAALRAASAQTSALADCSCFRSHRRGVFPLDSMSDASIQAARSPACLTK